MNKLILIALMFLVACGGGGKDESKDGDTNTNIGGSNVVVNPNIINNSAPVTINISPDAKDADKQCNDCSAEKIVCIETGEATSGMTDEQCESNFLACTESYGCKQPESISESTEGDASEEVFF